MIIMSTEHRTSNLETAKRKPRHFADHNHPDVKDSARSTCVTPISKSSRKTNRSERRSCSCARACSGCASDRSLSGALQSHARFVPGGQNISGGSGCVRCRLALSITPMIEPQLLERINYSKLSSLHISRLQNYYFFSLSTFCIVSDVRLGEFSRSSL